MTRLHIYTILAARCILLLIGGIVAIPIWIINVISLAVNTAASSYLSALLSFVSSTYTLNQQFEQQLKETNK